MKSKGATNQSQILWIEGRWGGNPNFVPLLRNKGFGIDLASTGKEAMGLAGKGDYDLLIINAASMRTSGARICKNFYTEFSDLPIILINNADQVADGVEEYVGYLLILDFTTRKLVNRIMSLLPGDPDNMEKVGNIVIDPDRNQVNCNGKQSSLTPRLMTLLKVFMDKPGEVIPREELFKNVWKTNYTGDTRTLDVHVSWLRQAIEDDPRNPKIIKTVRGIGYKLEV